MKPILIFLAFLLSLEVVSACDMAEIKRRKNETIILNPIITDRIRENLIHIFDSCSLISSNERMDMLEKIKKLNDQAGIEPEFEPLISITLAEPTRIVIGEKTLKIKKLWVNIRESDGLVSNLRFEKPNGDIIHLNMPDGNLVANFCSYALDLLKLDENLLTPKTK